MSQKVTIGGNRVGSGKKMQAELHNYYRSTHNLSEKWASTMSPGVLYPAMCKLAMRGDSFDIEINADCRTIPTKGPLFGTYKMQVDVYQCPIRLYQGILHNNPLAIGLQMNQIFFPELEINTMAAGHKDMYNGALNNSSLLKYLGLSGLGRPQRTPQNSIKRNVNAIPALAYYDIFKTYYANKQEEKGYIITAESEDNVTPTIENIHYLQILGGRPLRKYEGNTNVDDYIELPSTKQMQITIEGDNLSSSGISIEFVYNPNDETTQEYTLQQLFIQGLADLKMDKNVSYLIINEFPTDSDLKPFKMKFFSEEDVQTIKTGVIEEFDLSNIDDMRYDLLSNNRLGDKFVISYDENNYMPYSTLVDVLDNGEMKNRYPMNGLVLKTYQNDIFNNWLNTEWIEGENGINELTKVAVTDGAFSMDALNFATKLYNMLNRVALAGNTYEDWQDVVYEEVKRKQIESPIFCGGISQEVVFDEIVQTAPAEGDPLGQLGGRGRLDDKKKKGGKIHIKCDEACFIIAIISLTPRIYYTQGNEFYLTDVKTMDDLHKPAMDGIGFQDLIGERLAWWDTSIDTDGYGNKVTRNKVGKLPAWIEYMTSVDKAYGDFAEEYGKGYMILNRNYERDEDNYGIKDATTYVDPSKYNYAFAYDAVDSQNFWVAIHFGIRARRLMSARLIPNV